VWYVDFKTRYDGKSYQGVSRDMVLECLALSEDWWNVATEMRHGPLVVESNPMFTRLSIVVAAKEERTTMEGC
jgi:hypothetical protein